MTSMATPRGRRMAGNHVPGTQTHEHGLLADGCEDRCATRRSGTRRAPIVRGRATGASVALAVLLLGGTTAAGATVTGPEAAAWATKSHNLRPGSTGPAVRALQRALGIPADGVFGARTVRVVKAFQRPHGLRPSGVVGPRTATAIRAVAAQRATTPRSVAQISGPTSNDPTGAGADTTAAAPPSSSAAAQSAVAAAMSKQGAPYQSAATGPSSFDCSGLTSWAYRQAGVGIPRTSFAQFGAGSSVGRDEIRAGDLVFFNTAGAGASDVGIATSATSAVSATTHGVMVHTILSGYWGQHYIGARRVA